MLSVLQSFSFNPHNNLLKKVLLFHHVAEEGVKAQRGKMTYPQSQSQYLVTLGFTPGFSGSRHYTQASFQRSISQESHLWLLMSGNQKLSQPFVVWGGVFGADGHMKWLSRAGPHQAHPTLLRPIYS